MIDQKKILLLVPDGVGIKNYLYSKVFQDSSASITLFHNFDESTLAYLEKQIGFKDSFEIPKYKESVREKFLRELIHFSRLKANAKKASNPGILSFWKRGHKGVKLKVFYAAVKFVAVFIKDYKKILKLEKQYDVSLIKNPFYKQIEELLIQHKPEVIFCTHQRALKAPTIFAAAKNLGIRTITVIYSWDNIPKARLALKADKYLVWSSYMKQELQLFYPEISNEKISITGTPQFEFYLNPDNIIDKETFFRENNIDGNKYILCFSGDDAHTSPYDPNYLFDIANAISSADLEDKYQILFRRCPVDLSGRYDWVLKKFPDLIIDLPPKWNFNSKIWSVVYPTPEDVTLLVSLAYYADAVVNVGSTMAFDFGMFNKPCIFINYDHTPDKNWSVQHIYEYQHFRSMPSREAVYWLNSREEIVEVLDQAIENPNTKIKEWFNVVVNDASNTSKNIIKELF